MSGLQQFGGDWTERKLQAVGDYLRAYTIALSQQKFELHYVDAFAGTGYREVEQEDDEPLFDFKEPDACRFLDGSASIAMKVAPPFHKYIFVEKSLDRMNELQRRLRSEFPDRMATVEFQNSEANAFLQTYCAQTDWRRKRAVLFLDPFGMQVQWSTIQKIASTEAIDLWLLFPLGVVVNRLLRRDGKINTAWQQRLNEMFGTTDWFAEFYEKTMTQTLFDSDEEKIKKAANSEAIGKFFVKRLRDEFPGVAKQPLALSNSKGCALYLLCFACANKRGAKLALKIAQHILERKQ